MPFSPSVNPSAGSPLYERARLLVAQYGVPGQVPEPCCWFVSSYQSETTMLVGTLWSKGSGGLEIRVPPSDREPVYLNVNAEFFGDVVCTSFFFGQAVAFVGYRIALAGAGEEMREKK